MIHNKLSAINEDDSPHGSGRVNKMQAKASQLQLLATTKHSYKFVMCPSELNPYRTQTCIRQVVL